MIKVPRHDVSNKNKYNQPRTYMHRVIRLDLTQMTGLKDVPAHLVKKKIQRDLSSQLILLSEMSGQHIR